MIRMTVTKWWLVRNVTELPFGRVRGIRYAYEDFGTSWSLNLLWTGRTDSLEVFHVGLALRDPTEELRLFAFVGEGSRETGWSGVILGGDDVVDFRGTQDRDSRGFVHLLRASIGVEVVSD